MSAFLFTNVMDIGAGIAQWYSAVLRAGWLGGVQTGPRAHAASYPMGTRGFFPGGKTAGA
jgi:hypothetical protein